MALNLHTSFDKKNATKSNYKATPEVIERTQMVVSDYEVGHHILNKPWEEYNFRSIIEEVNANRKSFNSYVPPRSQDPNDSWRAQTIRPIVRAKLISIAAHVTANMIVPGVFAQNANDQEDKEAAKIFVDLIEWAIENSNYERSFINAVITALVDPVVYVNQDFREVMKKVRMMKDDGTYEVKEIVDEVMSGFATHILPTQDVYFSNMFEPDIQRQRFIILRKAVDYADAKAVYGSHPDFAHVKKGYQTLYISEENSFYEQRDETIKENQVEVVTYWNRSEDLELTYVNGILVCDVNHPMRRADKLYPIAKSGYEPVNNGVFFMYKSAANKIGYDEDLINTLYNYVMDGTFLALMPPMALYGDEDIDGPSVIVPGAVTSLREKSRLESIAPRSDLRAGLEAINVVEKSIAESTQDSSRQGVAGGREQTAYEVATLEQNAKTALGLFGKMIGFLVQDIGKLMLGDVIQYMTVPMLSEITGIDSPLKYKTILVPNRIEGGKKKTRKIVFDDDLLGSEEMSDSQLFDKSLKVLEEEGMDSDMSIAYVNPQLIKTVKTKVYIDPKQMASRSLSLERAMKLELYDRAIQNPTVDIGAVTSDFLFEPFELGSADKYMKKEQAQPNPMGMNSVNEMGTLDTPKGVSQNLVGQITGNNSLKNAQLNA